MSVAVDNVLVFPDWKTKLAKRKNGEPYGDERNVMLALEHAPELSKMLRYDAFNDRIEFDAEPPWADHGVYPGTQWSDEHRVALQVWLQGNGIPVNRGSTVQDTAVAVAKRHAYDPLQEKLAALRWDGEPRMSSWLHDYFGAEGNPQYLTAVGRAFLVGAVARAFRAGEKVDTVLVLESPQGRGKSTAIRILNYGFGTDYMPDLHSKDAAQQIQGTWINELSELAAVTRSDLESTKSFLSRTVDKYRPPYGRNPIERRRRCVFVGSTNLNEYLHDETGGRRFWPVRCREIRLDLLEVDVDQLWAEAIHAYGDQEQWHLARDLEPLAENEQELRRLVTEDELRLREQLDQYLKDGTTEVLMRDLLRDVAGFDDLKKQGREAGGIARVFSRVLASAGWEKLRPIGRGERRRQPYRFVGAHLISNKQAQADFVGPEELGL